MINLNGVNVQDHFNGVGMHDTVGCYAAVMSYADAKGHATELRNHGVTLYKIFCSGGNKVERCRGYVDGGVLPIIRDWKETPWGRLPAQWVMPVDQIRMYANVGVQLFEIAGNEINIGSEWVGGNILRSASGIPEGLAKQPPEIRAMPNLSMPQDPAVLAKAAVDAFEVALNACAQVPGTYPLLTSCTPGGNVDHRRVYPAIVAELNRRRLMSSVKHVAIHPRPHNNPPDTVWTADNTVTFDEWRWIRDQFPPGIYFWATEHGYSLNDDQNHNYPRIDLNLHTEYNWELAARMNPAHAKAIKLELAGTCHWFESGWGAWGAWPKDALRDSIVPEMPAPSPYWIRLGDRKNELSFSRYGGAPPPIDYAKGIDCSAYNDVNWQAVKDAGYSFAIIRALERLPNSGPLIKDSHFDANWDGAGRVGLLRGVYHTLWADLDGQAKLFYETVAPRVPEMGWWFGLETAGLTGAKCKLAHETMDGWTKGVTNTYTRASFFDKFGSPSWVQGRALWVASPGVQTPVLPKAWTKWKIWQYGQSTIGGTLLDVNRYNGTVKDLHDEYGGGEPPTPGGKVKIYKVEGNGWVEADWAWLQGKYGVGEKIDAPAAKSYWQITEIREQADGSNVCFVTAPPGTPVISYYTTAPKLDPTYNREWHDQGDVGIADVNGQASFGMYSNYFPDKVPFRGPYEVWCGLAGQHSERFYIGMVAGTNHHHLRLKFVWHEETEPPVDDNWTVLFKKLDQIIALLNS